MKNIEFTLQLIQWNITGDGTQDMVTNVYMLGILSNYCKRMELSPLRYDEVVRYLGIKSVSNRNQKIQKYFFV